MCDVTRFARTHIPGKALRTEPLDSAFQGLGFWVVLMTQRGRGLGDDEGKGGGRIENLT